MREWQVAAPDNFALNTDGTLIAIKCPHVTFEVMCDYVKLYYNKEFLNIIKYIYTFLSQQAHMTSFSNGFLSNYRNNVELFLSIAQSLFPTYTMLLGKIKDSEEAQAKLEAIFDKNYGGLKMNILD